MMRFEPLRSFGMGIHGLDLTRDLDAQTRSTLYDLWLDHGILLFRNPGHTADMQLTLAQCFGPLQPHPIENIRVEGEPNLIFLGSENDILPVHIVNDQAKRGFLYWHSDLTYVPEINKGSLLRLMELPADGGNTEWADTEAAYKDLPEGIKRRIASLGAVHTLRSTPERAWGMPGTEIRTAEPQTGPGSGKTRTFPLVIHPLVITHQETGRKSLMLSPLSFVKIDGLPEDEGNDLFEELMQHVLKDEYRYVHNWEVGDMILWDNRRTMHFATGYPLDDNRLAMRATLAEVQNTGRLYGSP